MRSTKEMCNRSSTDLQPKLHQQQTRHDSTSLGKKYSRTKSYTVKENTNTAKNTTMKHKLDHKVPGGKDPPNITGTKIVINADRSQLLDVDLRALEDVCETGPSSYGMNFRPTPLEKSNIRYTRNVGNDLKTTSVYDVRYANVDDIRYISREQNVHQAPGSAEIRQKDLRLTQSLQDVRQIPNTNNTQHRTDSNKVFSGEFDNTLSLIERSSAECTKKPLSKLNNNSSYSIVATEMNQLKSLNYQPSFNSRKVVSKFNLDVEQDLKKSALRNSTTTNVKRKQSELDRVLSFNSFNENRNSTNNKDNDSIKQINDKITRSFEPRGVNNSNSGEITNVTKIHNLNTQSNHPCNYDDASTTKATLKQSIHPTRENTDYDFTPLQHHLHQHHNENKLTNSNKGIVNNKNKSNNIQTNKNNHEQVDSNNNNIFENDTKLKGNGIRNCTVKVVVKAENIDDSGNFGNTITQTKRTGIIKNLNNNDNNTNDSSAIINGSKSNTNDSKITINDSNIDNSSSNKNNNNKVEFVTNGCIANEVNSSAEEIVPFPDDGYGSETNRSHLSNISEKGGTASNMYTNMPAPLNRVGSRRNVSDPNSNSSNHNGNSRPSLESVFTPTNHGLIKINTPYHQSYSRSNGIQPSIAQIQTVASVQHIAQSNPMLATTMTSKRKEISAPNIRHSSTSSTSLIEGDIASDPDVYQDDKFRRRKSIHAELENILRGQVQKINDKSATLPVKSFKKLEMSSNNTLPIKSSEPNRRHTTTTITTSPPMENKNHQMTPTQHAMRASCSNLTNLQRDTHSMSKLDGQLFSRSISAFSLNGSFKDVEKRNSLLTELRNTINKEPSKVNVSENVIPISTNQPKLPTPPLHAKNMGNHDINHNNGSSIDDIQKDYKKNMIRENSSLPNGHGLEPQQDDRRYSESSASSTMTLVNVNDSLDRVDDIEPDDSALQEEVISNLERVLIESTSFKNENTEPEPYDILQENGDLDEGFPPLPDIYNCFPLEISRNSPTDSKSTENTNCGDIDSNNGDREDGMGCDERPINKENVMAMLTNHLRDKTGIGCDVDTSTHNEDNNHHNGENHNSQVNEVDYNQENSNGDFYFENGHDSIHNDKNQAPAFDARNSEIYSKAFAEAIDISHPIVNQEINANVTLISHHVSNGSGVGNLNPVNFSFSGSTSGYKNTGEGSLNSSKSNRSNHFQRYGRGSNCSSQSSRKTSIVNENSDLINSNPDMLQTPKTECKIPPPDYEMQNTVFTDLPTLSTTNIELTKSEFEYIRGNSDPQLLQQVNENTYTFTLDNPKKNLDNMDHPLLSSSGSTISMKVVDNPSSVHSSRSNSITTIDAHSDNTSNMHRSSRTSSINSSLGQRNDDRRELYINDLELSRTNSNLSINSLEKRPSSSGTCNGLTKGAPPLSTNSLKNRRSNSISNLSLNYSYTDEKFHDNSFDPMRPTSAGRSSRHSRKQKQQQQQKHEQQQQQQQVNDIYNKETIVHSDIKSNGSDITDNNKRDNRTTSLQGSPLLPPPPIEILDPKQFCNVETQTDYSILDALICKEKSLYVVPIESNTSQKVLITNPHKPKPNSPVKNKSTSTPIKNQNLKLGSDINKISNNGNSNINDNINKKENVESCKQQPVVEKKSPTCRPRVENTVFELTDSEIEYVQGEAYRSSFLSRNNASLPNIHNLNSSLPNLHQSNEMLFVDAKQELEECLSLSLSVKSNKEHVIKDPLSLSLSGKRSSKVSTPRDTMSISLSRKHGSTTNLDRTTKDTSVKSNSETVTLRDKSGSDPYHTVHTLSQSLTGKANREYSVYIPPPDYDNAPLPDFTKVFSPPKEHSFLPGHEPSYEYSSNDQKPTRSQSCMSIDKIEQCLSSREDEFLTSLENSLKIPSNAKNHDPKNSWLYKKTSRKQVGKIDIPDTFQKHDTLSSRKKHTFRKKRTDDDTKESGRQTPTLLRSPMSSISKAIGKSFKMLLSPKNKLRNAQSVDCIATTPSQKMNDIITRRKKINSSIPWGFDINEIANNGKNQIPMINGNNGNVEVDDIDYSFISNNEWLKHQENDQHNNVACVNSNNTCARQSTETHKVQSHVKRTLLPQNHRTSDPVKNGTKLGNTGKHNNIGQVILPHSFAEDKTRTGFYRRTVSRQKSLNLNNRASTTNPNEDHMIKMAREAAFNSLDVNKEHLHFRSLP